MVLDIGNTNLVLGLYRGEKLAHSYRLHTNRQQTADEYGLLLKSLLAQTGATPDQVEGVGVSNVVPELATRIEEACQRYLGHHPRFVSARLELGLTLQVDRPTEVGADLIAGAVAARERWGLPVVVVDLGTATTLSVISSEGAFLGTIIAPGLEISVDAISRRAPHLPGIRMEPPPRPFGTNTVHSLQAGLVLGHVAMIDGLVDRIREHLELPDLKVGATGGLAPLVSGLSRTISMVESDLVLEGIRLLYRRNVS
jgi:type III pantothenate kinase